MNAPLFVIACLAGMGTGWITNWTADVLPGGPPVRSPHRRPLLVLATTASFVVSATLLAGDWTRVLVAWLYCAFLLTVLVIDFEHHRVLNVLLSLAALIAAALSLLPQSPTPQSALLGGATGFGLFLVLALASRGSLGMGDVKLAGVIGLMLGYPAALNALILGVVLAAVAALWLLFTHQASLKSQMAYAPYLALSAIAWLWLTWS